LPAVAHRQHEIDDEQVGLVPTQNAERLSALVGDEYGKAILLEVGAQDSRDLPVIVRDEDALGQVSP
jgi:hypothetical protein